MLIKLFFFSETKNVKHIDKKIEYVIKNTRPTYRDFFEYFNLNYPNEIVLLSNLDIFFDETISEVKNINLDSNVLALTRYDFKNNQWVLFNENNVAQASQDTWVFKTPLRLESLDCNFNLGVPGCDNRIAYEFYKSGYNVINNSLKIKTYHKHDSNYRIWEVKKISPVPPPYLYVKPTL